MWCRAPSDATACCCELYAATTAAAAGVAYISEFIALTRTLSLTQVSGVSAL